MRLLVIEQNGQQRTAYTEELPPGKAGSLRTLQFALAFIREDAALDMELRRVVLALVQDCRPRDFDCEVSKLFEAAKQIRFVRDPNEVDRVADATTTAAEGQGDCLDKAIWFCSALGSIGYISRIVAVNFEGDLATHGFDHAYCEVLRETDAGESFIAYDPTPENAPEGWEADAPQRQVFEIWPDASAPRTDRQDIGAGWLDQVIGTGVQLGTQWAAGQIQQGHASGDQAREVGRQFDNFDKQLAAALSQLLAQPSLTVDQVQGAAQAINELAAFAQQYGGVQYVANQWASEGPRYQSLLQALANKVPGAAAGAPTTGAAAAAATAAATQPSWLSGTPWSLILLAVVGLILVRRLGGGS